MPIINEIIESDKKAHRKQRHTAQRIFERLRDEHGYYGGLTIVAGAVRRLQCGDCGVDWLSCSGTGRIRGGACGVMLLNHAPLVIAEQIGTLEALYPGRIDLGLGRAPETGQVTARALRNHRTGSSADFPEEIIELQKFLEPRRTGQQVMAMPGVDSNVPIWILGSSLLERN